MLRHMHADAEKQRFTIAIVEYWLVDLASGTVNCYTSPHVQPIPR